MDKIGKFTPDLVRIDTEFCYKCKMWKMKSNENIDGYFHVLENGDYANIATLHYYGTFATLHKF